MKLRWYIDGGITRTKIEVGGKHKLDADYEPLTVTMMVRIVGSGSTSTIRRGPSRWQALSCQGDIRALVSSTSAKITPELPDMGGRLRVVVAGG